MKKDFDNGTTRAEPAAQANWLKQNPEHKENLKKMREERDRLMKQDEQNRK